MDSNFNKEQSYKIKGDIINLLIKYRVPRAQLRMILDDVVWWIDESTIICNDSINKGKIPYLAK